MPIENNPLRSQSRATLTTLVNKLDDALGNKDGLLGNEDMPAGTPSGSFAGTNPLLYRANAFFQSSVTRDTEERRIDGFLTETERKHGPITSLSKPAHVSEGNWLTFRADKAISLARFSRTPAEVTEHVVTARGTVDGKAIEARELFVQRYAPIGTPTGKLIVLSPGFLESGRNYVEQANLLNRQGHDVVVLDHQWAGLSTGKRGGIDSGHGIARDVGAATAQAAQWAKAAYGDKGQVIIAGTSMGGGAGALGAILMNDAGLMKLVGAQMPKGVSVVLQDAFFARTESFPNALLAVVGKIPLANQLPLPAFGLPILSHDRSTLMKIAAHATTDDLSGRGQAFHASTEFLARMKDQLQAGVRPDGKVYLIHARQDPLARYEDAAAFAELLGPQAKLHTIESDSHVIEENAREQRLILDGIAFVS
jgi:pimeloyl-ACP methyl ester carboxylesterase